MAAPRPRRLEGALTPHEPGTTGWPVLDVVVVAVLATASVGHLVLVRRVRRRGSWSRGRSACWHLGLSGVAVGAVGPLADAAHGDFRAHMAVHLLVGMVAPLLLVLSAPVTVVLRALPVARARVLSRVLRSRPVRLVSSPVVAGAANLGGLWVLYSTGLFALMHTSAPVHAAVHLHVLVTGYLFTASVVGVDPQPHRATVTTRSLVLVGFVAGHSILAKWLYAHPPDGVAASDGRAGALLMYHGGDAVDVALMVLLLAGWYRSTAPRPRPARPADVRTG